MTSFHTGLGMGLIFQSSGTISDEERTCALLKTEILQQGKEKKKKPTPSNTKKPQQQQQNQMEFKN